MEPGEEKEVTVPPKDAFGECESDETENALLLHNSAVSGLHYSCRNTAIALFSEESRCFFGGEVPSFDFFCRLLGTCLVVFA